MDDFHGTCAHPLISSKTPAETRRDRRIAGACETPVTVAHYLGLTPKWVDGTAVRGCSFARS
jgi:hypothetical protein